MAVRLFEEARYCFAYGQFLATIVLGFAYIEHTLASLLYMSGRDEAERARASDLLKQALDRGLINETEFDNLDRARGIRNSVAHFQPLAGGDHEEMLRRVVRKSPLGYAVIEQDARHVMATALRLIDMTGG